jgi:hypothetical protein
MNNDPMDAFELGSAVRQILDQQKQFLIDLKELDTNREHLEMTFREVWEDFYNVSTSNKLLPSYSILMIFPLKTGIKKTY